MELGPWQCRTQRRQRHSTVFFASVLTAKVSPQEYLTQETREKGLRKEDFPFIEEDWTPQVHTWPPQVLWNASTSAEGTWWTSFLSHSQSSLKGHDNQERCLRVEKIKNKNK